MFFKCLLFLFILGYIDADFGVSPRTCPYPRFEHGRFRMRQKSKLVKFVCFPGYTLVGNKYATCRNAEWDVPIPVCVKPGCQLPSIKNGIPMATHNDAWVVFFCFPRHNLIGSPVIYCDGRRWNATAPTCIDSTAPSYLSCDFEDPNLCGWKQDELHDFDWLRLNKKTPSSFLFTGPSFDHTFGKNGTGYYMYIESTSQMENDTARLISPIYDANLTRNGCFSFFYHMYGKTTGGLRVYQKPEHLTLPDLLRMSDEERQKYVLFDKRGNQGDQWYSAVSMLTNSSDDFQIVIEGIRGSSYTSDIAIDDVAILQGENCTVAKNSATTPAVVMPDSCTDRCDLFGVPTAELGCGCTASCVAASDCCPDFFDLCVFDSSTTPDDNVPVEFPQTQKLVAPLNTTAATTTPTTTPTTTSTTTKSTTTTTTPKPIPTTIKTTTEIVKITTLKVKTTPPPTLPPKKTTKIQKETRKIEKTSTLSPTTKKTIKITTENVKKTNKKFEEDKSKQEKERKIEAKKMSTESKSGGRTAVVTIVALLCCAGVAWLVAASRTSRGREAIARLRGRTSRDPDVRYLTANVDDD